MELPTGIIDYIDIPNTGAEHPPKMFVVGKEITLGISPAVANALFCLGGQYLTTAARARLE